MTKLPQIEIDTSQIPDCHRFSLLAVVFEEIDDYFKQPGVEEEFQEWLKEERVKQAAKAKRKDNAHHDR